jgi:ATP adenylyltransferase
MAFIQSEKAPDCFFCAKARERDDRRNFVLYRGEHNFVLLNAYPYAAGHLMIAPYAHQGNLVELSSETTTEMMDLAKRSIRALRKAYRTESFNVGMNLGAAAGAGIADHIHLHVVPRWIGDSNFMSVLGQTRLIPETIEATYDRLREADLADESRPVTPAQG